MSVIYKLPMPDAGIIILKPQVISVTKWDHGYKIDLKTEIFHYKLKTTNLRSLIYWVTNGDKIDP